MENVELLSRLPEELIHRILGFLNTKDAVRAILASKSVEAAWLSSCPSLHFLSHDFIPKIANLSLEEFDKQLNQYHKYVFYTMSRVSRSHKRIRSFEFQTYYLTDSETLDNWIDVALDRHAVQIIIGNAYGVPYCLPKRVLSTSSFLKSLDLNWGEVGDSVLTLPPLLGFRINLPCLQSLTLTWVSMNGESFQTLLKGCPSLEHLNITPIPELLSNLNISHLKLKSLHVYSRPSLHVEVEAPCLEEFRYSSSGHEDEAGVIIKTYKNLKRLCLMSSMEWLSALLPRCTALESLDINLLYLRDTIFKIRNPYVKNIALTYKGVGEIEIDCPMLLSLCWNYQAYGSLPSLSVIKPHSGFEGHFHIRNCSHTNLNNAWFHNLREFLSTSRVVAMSLLCSANSEKQIENRDNESLPTSAVEIGLLYLMIRSGLPESCYTFIMNGFLSTCHPHTIHLATPPEEEGKEAIHFIEFFLEKLENWKDAHCYCSSEIKCWKHQLKSVEIQEFNKFEGKERDRYNFGILQPEPPSFRLKFLWY